MISWLFAKFYDQLMMDAEERCLREWRQSLLKNLSGTVLELGCGTGANLEFYPEAVKDLQLIEPNHTMRQNLDKKLLQYPRLQVKTLDFKGELLPFPANHFDSVVSTLVLCSVKNPRQMLSETYRVLKPNGKLIFIEHVAATENLSRLKWQKRLEPFWKILNCGCHLTRPTERSITEAGFKIEAIAHQSMRGVPPIVRPSIRGYAIK
jgi:ubiquinone/menaquinone biosynthesis C-methylase UbiE